MLPAAGVLVHFSEDPGITEFVPHVAATSQQPEAYVWTVDALNSPCYWFPRQCPRVCHWEPGGRVHAIERGWLDTIATTTLHAYPFAASDVEPFGDRPHAFVSTRPVRPHPAEAGMKVAAPDRGSARFRVRCRHGESTTCQMPSRLIEAERRHLVS